MNNRPRRNKSKDNPYTLAFDEQKNIYTVEFMDNRKTIHKVEVSEKVYQAFDKFELENISQIHKYRKHIEHSELYDETIWRRSINKAPSIDEIVEKNITYENIRKAINNLSNIQKRRIIKYFFEGKNECEIAKEENTTQQAINKSIKHAIEKLRKFKI